jgi:hypothetical protein
VAGGRSGGQDAERFVVAPDLQIPGHRGWLLPLRHNLIHDLAALNKYRDCLLWDQVGTDEIRPIPLEASHGGGVGWPWPTLTSGADPSWDRPTGGGRSCRLPCATGRDELQPCATDEPQA